MGNIPLHFNCLCPIKDKEDSIKQDVAKIEKTISDFEFKEIPELKKRIFEIERSNQNIGKLENKIDRLEDKIEMKFEMLFLNMKIKKSIE
jgi:peptidoglycan hydrolase CwlO-like protein